jgi:KDO2-lipid IV(A) lauroyltransferase
MKFLNQETAVLHGPEKYARLHNFPVFYARIRKVRRGKYIAGFILLEQEPRNTQPGEITERFMRRLEEDILEDPRYYLWSHRRWKLKR